MTRKSLAVLTLVILVLLAVIGYVIIFKDEPVPEAGDGEPEISFSALELLTGQIVEFPADFQDRVVFLAYFSDG